MYTYTDGTPDLPNQKIQDVTAIELRIDGQSINILLKVLLYDPMQKPLQLQMVTKYGGLEHQEVEASIVLADRV